MSEKRVTFIKTSTSPSIPEPHNFKVSKSAIKEMYADDISMRRNVNKTSQQATTINSIDIEAIRNLYYNLTPELEQQRKFANELYLFYPVFASIVDYLSNMFTWEYIYTPRMVKEKKNNTDYQEMYNLMGEVVDGLSIETTFPNILTKLFVDGAVYLISVKNTSSKTITTLALPTKYCRVNAMTQFGTYTYQFDFSYFGSLGMNKTELEQIFMLYPPEMLTMYNEYLTDRTKKRWQQLDSKYAAAMLMNSSGFPTLLNSIFSIKQYDKYLDNELERNEQQLDKIIAHTVPVYEDKLVVDMDETTELHKSMAKQLSRNSHTRLLTTFGGLEVLSIGQDQTKENKTLENAFNAIFDNVGENNNLFSDDSKESLLYSLKRDESKVWKYVQQLINIYNIIINNSFNFKGYQCDLRILPITLYNKSEMLMLYKESATLGIGKLEYIISSGIKQIDISSKIELEDYLGLDKLKPLSTSYTQNDNTKKNDNSIDADSNKDNNKKVKEQEVVNNEQDTK